MARAASAQTLMRVIAPVADLRSERKDAAPDTYAHDPLEESQLVFGELVQVHQIEGDWALVEGVEQKEYTHKKKWEGYPGWMKTSALGPIPFNEGTFIRGVVRKSWASIYTDPASRSAQLIRVPFGSRIHVWSRRGEWFEVSGPSAEGMGWMRRSDVEVTAGTPMGDAFRSKVWKNARLFLGVPYYWGGLSAYAADYKGAVTGVDCSGLTHLCYRAASLIIPRDSHEQWMTSKPLKRAELRRGDLVFLANAEKPDKVVHVAMYVGGEFLIEGPGTGLKVHRVTFKRKFGRRLSAIESGDTVGKKVVYFGRPVMREEVKE